MVANALCFGFSLPLLSPLPDSYHLRRSSRALSPMLPLPPLPAPRPCMPTMALKVSTPREIVKETLKTLDPPVFELTLEFPAKDESGGFYESYKEMASGWPTELLSSRDCRDIERFVGSAHAFVRKWLPPDVVARIESFLYDPLQPPALVLRGLPIEHELPPTSPEGIALKQSSPHTFITETWLAGIARLIGQPFTYEFLVGHKSGTTASLVQNVYPIVSKEKSFTSSGSKYLLDLHSDFFQTAPSSFPHAIAFIGLRGDPSRAAKTLLCDSWKLCDALNPDDIALLRGEPITWSYPHMSFSKHIIEGPKESPMVNLFDENVNLVGGFDEVVEGKTEVVAAYRRLKDKARDLALKSGGVWLGKGDVLIMNQRRVTHGRTCFAAKYDGNDRWMQRVYVNEGCIWQPVGFVPWPTRALPFNAQ